MMGDFYDQTTIHPLGLTAVLALGVLMVLLPRRFAILPMIVMACFIAPAQRVVVLGADFNLLRIMVIFGSLRVLTRAELSGIRWHSLDGWVGAWGVCGAIVLVVQNPTSDCFAYTLGRLYDILGMYFLFRVLVQSWIDLDMLIRGIVVISVPVAVFFLVEQSTGKNAFAFLGGVPFETLVRGDRLRCQGAFAHPILAGCFWALLVPLILSRWWHGGLDRVLCGIGLATALTIIFTCSSSTPVTALIFAAIGMAMYFFRWHTRALRWGLLVSVVGLHLIMNHPVWHLIARLDFVGGSTGYHRYLLIDAAVRNFGDWWLFGTTTTQHWGEGLDDITNQYILEGVRGGLATLVLFTGVISVAFSAVGRMWREAPDPMRRRDAWTLGVVLFVHVTNFIGVSYFGQIEVLWFLTLGATASICAFSQAMPARRTVLRVRSPGEPMANAMAAMKRSMGNRHGLVVVD